MKNIILFLTLVILSSCVAKKHATCINPYYGMAILSPYMYYDLGVDKGNMTNYIFNDTLRIENLHEKYQVILPRQLFDYEFNGNANILIHYTNFIETKRELTSLQVFATSGLEKINYYKYDQKNKYCVALPDNLLLAEDSILSLFNGIYIDRLKIAEPTGSIMIRLSF